MASSIRADPLQPLPTWSRASSRAPRLGRRVAAGSGPWGRGWRRVEGDGGWTLGDEGLLVAVPVCIVKGADRDLVVGRQLPKIGDLVEACPVALAVLSAARGRAVAVSARVRSTFGMDVAQIAGDPGDAGSGVVGVRCVDEHRVAEAVVIVEMGEEAPRLAAEGHPALSLAHLDPALEVDQGHWGQDRTRRRSGHGDMLRTLSGEEGQWIVR